MLIYLLIAELFQNLKLKPTKVWNDKFDLYLKHIPPYYYGVNFISNLNQFIIYNLIYH